MEIFEEFNLKTYHLYAKQNYDSSPLSYVVIFRTIVMSSIQITTNTTPPKTLLLLHPGYLPLHTLAKKGNFMLTILQNIVNVPSFIPTRVHITQFPFMIYQRRRQVHFIYIHRSSDLPWSPSHDIHLDDPTSMHFLSMMHSVYGSLSSINLFEVKQTRTSTSVCKTLQ